MQNNYSKKDGKPDNAAQQAADREINERLVEHLRANAIKSGQASLEYNRMPQRGFFSEVYGLVGIAALMAVAYVYTVLVGNDA